MPTRFPLFLLLRVLLVCGLITAGTVIASVRSHAVEAIGGPFTLTAHTGQPISDKDLAGKPYALFFGFTHCPDVCPTALFELSQVLVQLGKDGDGITPLFITVDPERDTLDLLGKYVGAFDPRIIGLRGTEAETTAIARAFRVTYRKVPSTHGDYTLDHTAAVYLVDRNGDFFDTVDYRAPLDTQVAKFRAVIEAR